jgi:hypothetical protein
MKANIEVSYAPDGEVLEIIIPDAIQALPLEARLALWDEVTFMIEGMQYDKAGIVARIGGNEASRCTSNILKLIGNKNGKV